MSSAARYRVLAAAMFALALPYSASAQRDDPQAKYEFGAGVMGSFYDSQKLTGPTGSAEAGFQTGIGGSVWLGQDMYEHLSGEVRYDFARNRLKLTGAGGKAGLDAISHTIHYDLHYNLAGRDSAVRPYILAGAGVKFFEGTGTPEANQPLMSVAWLNRTSETRPLVTVGAGLKFRLGRHVNLRLEVRDNLSPFPKKVITPTGSRVGSAWTNNFLPFVGIGLTF